uniref:Uncharacterized protein n=1 Tax=Gossypium raimondii TaxID=29730 RepID=A0A0D2RVM6_GOSRA|nr:hypothetical protein B456_009G070000 [Gossypium raimondii]
MQVDATDEANRFLCYNYELALYISPELYIFKEKIFGVVYSCPCETKAFSASISPLPSSEEEGCTYKLMLYIKTNEGDRLNIPGR